jgi:hypothetical protein
MLHIWLPSFCASEAKFELLKTLSSILDFPLSSLALYPRDSLQNSITLRCSDIRFFERGRSEVVRLLQNSRSAILSVQLEGTKPIAQWTAVMEKLAANA